MDIQIRPAIGERFDDVALLLAPKDPAAPACWCLSYRFSSSAPGMGDGQGRAALMRGLCSAPVSPGVLAYLDGQVVGWCSVSPRTSYQRLSRTFAYTGTRSLFEGAGFTKVADTTSRTGGVLRVVMRKNLAGR